MRFVVTPELGIADPPGSRTLGRVQANVQRMGRAQAKAVGATGADRLRTYGSDEPA